MAYNLQVTKTGFKSGKNILASEHVKFVEGGATIDGALAGNGVIPVGTAVVRGTNGKYAPYDATTHGAELNAFTDEAGILNVDVEIVNGADAVVGEVIVEGAVYDAKLPQDFPTAVKYFLANGGRVRFVKHV